MNNTWILLGVVNGKYDYPTGTLIHNTYRIRFNPETLLAIEEETHPVSSNSYSVVGAFFKTNINDLIAESKLRIDTRTAQHEST